MPANPTLPMNPTLPADTTLTVVTTMVTTQTPVAKSAAMTATSSLIPLTVYNLAQDKFRGIHCPSRKLKEEEGPSTPRCSNPKEEQEPEAAVTATASQSREDTPWPNTMPASMNLFDARAS